MPITPLILDGIKQISYQWKANDEYYLTVGSISGLHPVIVIYIDRNNGNPN